MDKDKRRPSHLRLVKSGEPAPKTQKVDDNYRFSDDVHRPRHTDSVLGHDGAGDKDGDFMSGIDERPNE